MKKPRLPHGIGRRMMDVVKYLAATGFDEGAVAGYIPSVEAFV